MAGVVPVTADPLPTLDELVGEARGYLAAAEAESRRCLLALRWWRFTSPTSPVPTRRAPSFAEPSASAKAHRRAGHLSPTEHESVRLVLAGIHRSKGPRFFAGHHVTQAKRNEATDLEVMSQTHHRSVESIAGYVREADLFRHTSAKRLGL